MNLTAIRHPEEIVTRHFGESLFAAQQLFPHGANGEAIAPDVVDVGSGAGFPGLPIKIWMPATRLTLIESNQKKATFLREVVRSLQFTDVQVEAKRAEDLPHLLGDVVTLRAVEQFEKTLPVAAFLTKTEGGRLSLLIGSSQVQKARDLAPELGWSEPVSVPQSESRVLLVGLKPAHGIAADTNQAGY